VCSSDAVCCGALRCVAVCCGVLRCVAVCCGVLQCVAVCCSVLRCVAVSCSVLQYYFCRAFHKGIIALFNFSTLYRALLTLYRALLTLYRALLTLYRAFSTLYRTLFTRDGAPLTYLLYLRYDNIAVCLFCESLLTIDRAISTYAGLFSQEMGLL